MSKRTNRPYKMIRNKETGVMEHKTIKDSEVKQKIMQAFNLVDDKAYRRFYDVQKNKIYAYNEFRGGDKPKIDSVQGFLYAQAKSRLKYGADYEPSAQTRLVNAMPAYSKSKGKKVHEMLQSQAHKDVQMRFAASIAIDMKEFIAAYSGTKDKPSVLDKIREKYKDDPAKLMGAMMAFADSLKEMKKDARGNYVRGEGGFPLGSTAGSPSATKFKYGEDEFSQ